ncbi:MAG: hypothetical protein AB1779_03890 [Candidatus Thermoplasmatota archaeon]
MEEELASLKIQSFPLLERNVIIETEIGYELGNVIYIVRIKNNGEEPIEGLNIKPSVQKDMFEYDEEVKLISFMAPGEVQTVVFRLRPLRAVFELGIEGKAIQGKDITIKTVLACENGAGSYKLMLKNNRNYSFKKIKVKPILPMDFVSLVPEEEVETLGPEETKVLTFPLITRGEWEILQEHERKISTPYIFQPEKPKRKKFSKPRILSDDELAEIKRNLLAFETVDEILERIGAFADEEEAVEFDFYWTEDVCEEESIEEDIESSMEEVCLEGPIEEDYLMEPAIFVKEIVAEEEAIEYEYEIEIPYEEVCGEGPIEEEYEFLPVKEVKPLGVKPTRAEEIETEPMEMEL